MSEQWKSIVREHGPVVYRIAWRILGNADDADDVVQDVFLEAHQFASGNKMANPVGLLKRVAVCRSLDRLRQRCGETSLDDLPIVDPESGPEAQAVGRELESACATPSVNFRNGKRRSSVCDISID